VAHGEVLIGTWSRQSLDFSFINKDIAITVWDKKRFFFLTSQVVNLL